MSPCMPVLVTKRRRGGSHRPEEFLSSLAPQDSVCSAAPSRGYRLSCGAPAPSGVLVEPGQRLSWEGYCVGRGRHALDAWPGPF